MQQYIIKRRNDTRTTVYPPKIVTATCVELVKKAYPDWHIYVYRETGNPVSVSNDHRGDFRIRVEIIPNIRFNKYCEFR